MHILLWRGTRECSRMLCSSLSYWSLPIQHNDTSNKRNLLCVLDIGDPTVSLKRNHLWHIYGVSIAKQNVLYVKCKNEQCLARCHLTLQVPQYTKYINQYIHV